MKKIQASSNEVFEAFKSGYGACFIRFLVGYNRKLPPVKLEHMIEKFCTTIQHEEDSTFNEAWENYLIFLLGRGGDS